MVLAGSNFRDDIVPGPLWSKPTKTDSNGSTSDCIDVWVEYNKERVSNNDALTQASNSIEPETEPVDATEWHSSLDIAEWERMPPEIKLEVLTKLSFTELLVHANTVSPFRDVFREHEAAIAQRVLIEPKKKDFQDVLDGFDYSKYESLLEAFEHWATNKTLLGYDEDSKGHHQGPSDFVHHYAACCGISDAKKTQAISSYVQTLVLKHNYAVVHRKLGDWVPMTREEALSIGTSISLPPSAKANQTGQPNDVQRMESRHLISTLYEEPPRRFNTLTKLTFRDIYHTGQSAEWIAVMPSVQRPELKGAEETAFLEMFDLPRILECGPEDSHGPRIAYCADFKYLKRIGETVREVMRREAAGEGLLRPLVEAKTLEHVFIW
ncbi:uncharacterized protein LTR77_010685 [Saxophila tyrrhenica]|uniref:F-box domain-containing protein n=1 Tax=Saxophila tyrrhenica TaxID=1690608 RepID=A0AAV9NYA7_9PEZI|nr:hypothetical protein LTR77_010685 [Saxophila tyrrhenica]